MLRQLEELPIFDGKRPLKLKITTKDINSADPKRPNSCAVAKACKRELHAKEVRVHLSRVYVRTNDLNWQRYMTPQNLRSEIVAFDRGGQFEPGTYTLGKVPHYDQPTGSRQGGKDKPGHKKSRTRKRAYHVLKNVRGGPA